MDAKAKLSKARAQMVLSQPFFGSLALRLEMIEAETLPNGQPNETMATDGRRLVYNAAFVDRLPMPELVGVVAHEVMHCAAQHTTRRAGRDPGDWNKAADYAINSILDAAGFTLPAEALRNPDFDGLSADAIYSEIHQDPPEDDDGQDDGDGGQPGVDPGQCGAVLDATGPDGGPLSQAEAAQLEQDWKVAAMQAEATARAQGKLPAGVDVLLDALRRPRVDWRETLRRFMDEHAKMDYSWFPPNRRHVASGLYLPSLRSEEMGEIVVAVDTSGSIDEELLQQFGGELAAILDELQPARTTAIYCDTAVNRVQTFEQGEAFTLNAKGRGGTAFSPVFEHVRKAGIVPAVLLYFTDLGASDFPPDPGYPVIWAAYGCRPDERAPVGETLHLGA